VAVLAAVHGDEPITIEVVRRLIIELTDVQLKGTVLAVPVMNPLGFESATRHTWIDMANLNRLFPGRLTGSISEHMAYAIYENVLSQADAVIDLHSGSYSFICDYSYVFEDVEFAQAFGSNAVIKWKPFPGSSSSVVHERGKPMVIAEFGGGIYCDEFYIQKGLTGVLNCLRLLDILPGEPVFASNQVVTTRMSLLRPRHGGLLKPEVSGEDIGRIVPKGTLLGQIISPYTFEVLEEFHAPFDKNMITLVGSGPVRMHPGDFAYMIVEPDAE
jgi:predicted deacylase